MSGSSSFDEQLSLLPDDIRALVAGLDPTDAAQLLEKLIRPTELSFRMLQEADVDIIKRRTAENSAFGFLSADVDITWQELQKPGYIALGAFDEQEPGGPEVPVAFVIAEVSRLDEIQEFYWELEDTPLPEPDGSQPSAGPQPGDPRILDPSPTPSSARGDSGGSHDGDGSAASVSSFPAAAGGPVDTVPAPARGLSDGRDLQQALRGAGWSGSDTLVSIFYVGVDFEYRRQGIGKQLLDLVKEVGEAARARLMWLTVAEWNPNALSFYLQYGFNKTQEVKKGKRGNHLMLVYSLRPQPNSPAESERARKGRGRKKGGKSKGFGAVACAAVTGASRASAAGRQAGCTVHARGCTVVTRPVVALFNTSRGQRCVSMPRHMQQRCVVVR